MATLVYHITHLNNLSLILNVGGLMAVNELRRSNLTYQNIAYEQIQDRRARAIVPCGAGGVLHDYVPFYFAPRSPMLYTIHRGNVPGYQDGQALIIHLVSSAEAVEAAGIAFAFTDGHAVMDYSDFYDDLDALEDVIDWELMESRYWRDTDDDPNRKCRRQAEFLAYNFVPWSLIHSIGVSSPQIKQQVEQVLQNVNLSIPVSVRSTWYY
jgi:ssDNA thymidine ADP-ribosyltransferase, DarT